MKREFIILTLIVFAALWFTFGCSIRLHCDKSAGGNTEKYELPELNSEEMCFDGCFKMYSENIHVPVLLHQCFMMCGKGCSSDVKWPDKQECMTNCDSGYKKEMDSVAERCQGQPPSCILNSPENKSLQQCYATCPSK